MRRKETLFILSLLLLALLPYFILCFHALPFADDFCYAWTSSEHISFAHRFIRQYMSWSGRYSAHVLLCLHPFVNGSLLLYHLADLIALSITAACIFIFIRCFIADLLTSVIAASAILLFYLCYIPQLAEGIYWYTGICNYLLSNDCLLLHLAALVICFNSQGLARKFHFAIAAVLLIVCIGFTEEAAALIPAYYLLAAIMLYIDRKKNIAFPFFIIAFLSSCTLVLAPGNYTRSHSHQFHEQYQLLHSIVYSFMQTARFTAIWLCTLPALVLSALIIARADKLKDSALYHVSHWLILSVLVFTVFMGAFIPYFSTGILGQHRTINYVFFYFIFLWLWWLISVSRKYLLYEKKPFVFVNKNTSAIIVICILVMTCTANGGNILRDTWHGTFTAYQNEFELRQAGILQHPGMPIPPLRSVPVSFEIVDARADSTWWVDKCMKYFHRDNLVYSPD